MEPRATAAPHPSEQACAAPNGPPRRGGDPADAVDPVGLVRAAEAAGAAAPAGMPHARAAGIGAYGERLAEGHLVEQGMTVLDRNWRCGQGEIDIVALDGDVLVVCEVKTRRSARFGAPVEGVTAAKLARLRRLACLWLAEHGRVVDTPGGRVSLGDLRIDVIGVLRPANGPALIEHLRAVS